MIECRLNSDLYTVAAIKYARTMEFIYGSTMTELTINIKEYSEYDYESRINETSDWKFSYRPDMDRLLHLLHVTIM
jgi:hypothetical protein